MDTVSGLTLAVHEYDLELIFLTAIAVLFFALCASLAPYFFLEPMRNVFEPAQARALANRKWSWQALFYFVGCTLSLWSVVPIALLWRVNLRSGSPNYFFDEWQGVVYFSVFILILIAGIVYQYGVRYYNARPVRFFCPTCGAYQPSTTPWICGRCRHENKSLVRFSYLRECEDCREAPETFNCHRCNEFICLNKGPTNGRPQVHSLDLAARRAPRQESAEIPREQVVKQQRSEREDIEHKISMAELTARLAERLKQLKKVLNVEDPKPSTDSETKVIEPTARERREKELQRHRDEQLSVHEVAREAREEAKKKYADDPDLLEQHLAVIQEFVEQNALS